MKLVIPILVLCILISLPVVSAGGVDKGYLSNGCDTVNLNMTTLSLAGWQTNFTLINGCNANPIVEVAFLFGPAPIFNATESPSSWSYGYAFFPQLGFNYFIAWFSSPGLGKGTLSGFSFVLPVQHTTVHWGTFVVKNGVTQLSGEGGFNL